MNHPVAIANPNEAQVSFDQKYITASEVLKDLGISRTTLLYARVTGKLPAPIVLNDGRLFLWERELIQPYLDSWKQLLHIRRGQ